MLAFAFAVVGALSDCVDTPQNGRVARAAQCVARFIRRHKNPASAGGGIRISTPDGAPVRLRGGTGDANNIVGGFDGYSNVDDYNRKQQKSRTIMWGVCDVGCRQAQRLSYESFVEDME